VAGLLTEPPGWLGQETGHSIFHLKSASTRITLT